jgi:archaellum biogenesis ATPase FlaH
MSNLKFTIDWLYKLLPQGLYIPSSTLISGPGGSGKPLVEFAFVAAWIKAGGSVIGIPLQYPTTEMVMSSLNKLYQIDLKQHQKKVAFIQFDPMANNCEQINSNTIKANMAKPEQWDKAISMAEELVEKSSFGTLIFGSALNLLLFAKNYKISILNKLKDLIQNDKTRTYVFAVSTSAMADEIKNLEDVVDNLMFTRMEKPMRLYLQITRTLNLRHFNKEIEVPIPKSMLKEINAIAEATRKTRINELRDMP